MEIIFIFLVAILFLLAVIAGITRLSDRKIRPIVFATLSMLLLTPSFAPATVVVVPVPFGVILAIGIFSGAIQEVPSLVSLFWQWHIVVFPLTWGVSYLLYISGKKYVCHNL